MKTICIDARLYGIAHTGIGRYVENLLRYLPHQPDLRIVLIIASENLHHPELAGYAKFVAKFHPYSPWAQLEMLYLWTKIHPDLLHVTHSSIPVFWPGKLVVTFHDLIKHYSRGIKTTTNNNEIIYWIKYLGYILVDLVSARRASHIIVPANYWKTELVKQYHLPPEKITVTYEGVDARFLRGRATSHFSLPRHFVIYTGNIYPHKNVEVLAQAIAILNGRVHLVLVGARSVFTARLEQLVRAQHIAHITHFLGRLSDSDLASVYRRALAFVFPSLIEGFGLTGLEAMAIGLPVIAARASCLPEIYGQAAIYFAPHNSQELAGKIIQVLENKTLRNSLIKKGLRQVKNYSWAKMSKQTWQIYLTVLH